MAALEPIPASGIDLEGHLEERRKAYMLAALEGADGVQARAARVLGMSFRSFRYFARKYGFGGSRENAGEPSDE